MINSTLVDAALEGDSHARLRLVELSEKYVYGALHTFAGLSSGEMDDLFQTVYLKLFEDDMRRVRLWNREARFTTYIYRIVINLVKDYFGSAAYRTTQASFDEDEEGGSVLDTIPADDRDTESIDPITLKYTLNQLKPNERRMIELYYFQGLKEREIASLLEMPLNTVSSLKNRTLKKLRKYLKETIG